jgi:hypothetical protein
LGTDDPLQFHETNEPLLEEYAVAGHFFEFTCTDKCEIARNSVLVSSFEHYWKEKWLGKSYYEKNHILANNLDCTNISQIRTHYRHTNLMRELSYVALLSGMISKAKTTPSKNYMHGKQLSIPPPPSLPAKRPTNRKKKTTKKALSKTTAGLQKIFHFSWHTLLIWIAPILAAHTNVLKKIGFTKTSRYRYRHALTLLAQLLLGRRFIFWISGLLHTVRSYGLKNVDIDTVGLIMRYVQQLPYIHDGVTKEKHESSNCIKEDIIDGVPFVGDDCITLPSDDLSASSIEKELTLACGVQKEYNDNKAIGRISHGEISKHDVEFDEMQTLSSRTGLQQYPSRRLGKYAMASQRSFMVIVSF